MNSTHTRILATLVIVSSFVALTAYQLSQFASDTSLSHWHNGAKGYQVALEQQKSSGKAIALFFHTDWCASCKNLRETVLSSTEFDAYIGDKIPVKINPEMGLDEKRIADNYGVIGYPTFLIITNNHRTITPIGSRRNTTPEQFIASCNKALQT